MMKRVPDPAVCTVELLLPGWNRLGRFAAGIVDALLQVFGWLLPRIEARGGWLPKGSGRAFTAPAL